METQFSRPRVAVIGAGISGLCLSRALLEDGLDVVTFEKSRGPGGRMSTRRAAESRYSFDHGAQFFTARAPEFVQQVADWQAAGVVAPWPGRLGQISGGQFIPEPTRHPRFVGVPRMSALTRHLSAGLQAQVATRIDALEQTSDGWRLHSTAGEVFGTFDVVISTAPSPQTAPLLAPHSPALAARADAAEMLPCFCLMLAFPAPLRVPFDAARLDTPPLGWIARNTSKPGRAEAECWVLHADAAWSKEHLEDDKAAVGQEMLASFTALTGAGEPEFSSLHRWRYARASGPFTEQEPILWDAQLGLGACGDWLAGERVEEAWRSAQAMAQTVRSWQRQAATLRT